MTHLDEELRRELREVADSTRPPAIDLAEVERLGARERHHRQGMRVGAVAAAIVVLLAGVPLVLGLSDKPTSPPVPLGPVSPAVTTGGQLGGVDAGDLDGDGSEDAAVLSGQRVAVALTSGPTVTWVGQGHGEFEVQGPADFGDGRIGLVLIGFTPDGGNDSLVVLIVRQGALVRAEHGGTSYDRQRVPGNITQTIWVEDGALWNAVCLCTPGRQSVQIWRVALKADGLTLVGREEAQRGCWDPESGRDPEMTPC